MKIKLKSHTFINKRSVFRRNISIKCDYCNKEFNLPRYLYNKRLKRNNKIYCSKKCSYEGSKKIVKCKFANCGKEIYKQPHKIKQSISGNVFCSHSCSSSYNNTFREKYSVNTYRRIAFEKYEHKCALCGWNEDERILEVHHIDENRKNNKLNNLIILCPICHRYLTLHLKTIEELRTIFSSRQTGKVASL